MLPLVEEEQRSSKHGDSRQHTRPRIVVIGAGMAAHGLCKKLVELGVHEETHVTILGEEELPAYDRVNASKILSGVSTDDLLLSPREWYAESGITLHTGGSVVEMDRQRQRVFTADGQSFDYDYAILATGSRAWVPPVQGVFVEEQQAAFPSRKSLLPGVFVYRTLDDLKAIREYIEQNQCTSSAVIGGGLLGLEAAKALLNLGTTPTIIEAANGLMPRQLTRDAAQLLLAKVQAMGVKVHTTRRTSAISRTQDGLSMQFDNAAPLDVDVLVIAAGVRPRDELAKSCGLAVGPRGGIVVDERLKTSDERIFAIGECVVFREYNYGLVAPCYRMADVLANRFAGSNIKFEGADESAELKLLGVPVIALGQPLSDFTAGVVLKYQDGERFRQILLGQGGIRGVAAVGEWDELPLLRYAVDKQKIIWPHQRRRFERTGRLLLSSGNLPVAQWPGDAVVCSCRAVTCDQIRRCSESSLQSIQTTTGAMAACGGCEPLVRELVGQKFLATAWSVKDRILVGASLLSIMVAAAWFVIGRIPFSTSVQSLSYSIEWWWKSSLGKQITGYSLVAATTVGLVVYVIKKRTSWVPWFSYASYRNVHVCSSLLALTMLIAHTGLSTGTNANRWLLLTFLSLAAVGGLTGSLSAIESRLTGDKAIFVRRWRPRLAALHLLLFGPLPILLIIHIVSVYWY